MLLFLDLLVEDYFDLFDFSLLFFSTFLLPIYPALIILFFFFSLTSFSDF